jgi:histidinol-phosphate aminotransferase
VTSDSASSPRLPAGYHSPQLDVEVRLNTNESPEPPPEGFLDELAAAVRGSASLNRYPDRDARALRAALAEVHGVRPEQIWCANGSNEVLQALLLAYGGPGRQVAVFEPTYALHSHLAQLTRSSLVVGARDGDFLVPAAEAERVAALRPAVILLCSPNNPTGLAEPRSTIEALLAAAEEALLVVDEAYGQFAACSAVELVDGAGAGAGGSPVVVRTFSKAWALAGLRLGYAVARPEVIEALAAASLPYHLDSLKQLAGVLALRQDGEMRARVERIVAARSMLAAGLAALPVEVWPSDANFLLFRPSNHDAHEVWEGLVARSVLVRELRSWERLKDCLRVTVGTTRECERFLEALAEVLG